MLVTRAVVARGNHCCSRSRSAAGHETTTILRGREGGRERGGREGGREGMEGGREGMEGGWGERE